MAEFPTGTVTFLFSDIEKSTLLLQRVGDAEYARILSDHWRILRAAITGGGGQELLYQGDGGFAVFRSARAAVLSAIAAQRALASHRWPNETPLLVRMGLHTGEPVSSSDGFVGLDVHRAARICDVGHGGQILISRTTSDLLQGEPSADIALKDLGMHRLKDLHRPEQIFQILHPDLRAEFPRLLSLDLVPNNLPYQLTTFIGREQQIEEVRRHLAADRLVTLTGPGGGGKSRLAIQVAAQSVDSFPEGAWLVELDTLRDPELVPQAVASTLGIREQPGHTLTTALVERLAGRRLLLVLDNCEHLLGACAELADVLLKACPLLCILATSRQALGILGEIPLLIPPLSLPDSERTAFDDLRRCEAIRLFVDRATAMSGGFVLTPENAAAVAGICARVDGMPLAIELAAARTHVLPLDQILLRLDNMFRLLTTGGRTSIPRHRTLRATLDWSYDPLPASEQMLLRRLSVFAGGFTLAAVEDVCVGEGLPREEILDTLSQLVDKSLVVAHSSDVNARYRMQETVRLYGGNRLAESGEASEIRARHCEFFLILAEAAEPHFRGPKQAEWLGHLEREDANLLAALHWAGTERSEAERCLRLAGALWRYWAIRGYFSEGRQILEGALSEASGASAARAKALHASGYLAYRMDDLPAARMRLQDAVSLFRELDDDPGTAFCLTSLGVVARESGKYAEAVALLEEALALARRMGDKWTLSRSLGSLGVVEEFRGNYSKAARLFEESLQASHRVSDAFGIAYALEHLGAVTAMQGRHEEARTMLEQALERFRVLGDRAHIAYTQYELGTSARLEGKNERAHALLLQSLVLSRDVGDRSRVARSLEGLANLAMSTEQVERAAVLCGAAMALRASIREPLPPAARRDHERLLRAIRAASKTQPLKGALARGRAMTYEQSLDYATAADPTSSPSSGAP